MIVKVQLSRHTTESARQVLVYDKTRRFSYQGAASPEVVKHMSGQDKAYFEAEIVGTQFSLGVMVPAQNW